MRARSIGMMALLASASLAQAASPGPTRPYRDPALSLLRDAATACFADGIRGNHRALTLARAGRWYEAAGLTASLCRPEVDAMVRRYDALHGFGSGGRYFTGAYAASLEKALATRMRPVLEAAAAAVP